MRRVGTGGQGSAYVPDMSKFQLMTNWLEAEKVLVLRSPCSGKTSFAVRFAMYLNDHVSIAYFMNAAVIRQRLEGGSTMDGVWTACGKKISVYRSTRFVADLGIVIST